MKNIKVIVAKPENMVSHKEPGIFFDIFLLLVAVCAKYKNLFLAKRLLKKELAKGKNLTLKKALWAIGRDPNHYSSIFADKYSKLNHDIKVYAGSWRALEIFYNFKNKYEPQLGRSFSDFLTRMWLGVMRNGQAIANRKVMVSDMLYEHMQTYNGEEPLKILSLASGSAEAVIDAVLRYGKPVKCVLMDASADAIEAAKRAVEEAGLSDQFEFVQTMIDPRTIRRQCKNFKPFIVEMVGLMDYFSDIWAVRVIKEIESVTVAGGLFITCNINNEHPIEVFALDWVPLWPMIYRNVPQWKDILYKGWIKDESSTHWAIIIYDSFKIHGIAKCFK